MSETKTYNKPLPQMEPEEKPYWASLKEHNMKIQRCNDCSRWYFPPRIICPSCLSENVAWQPVSGKGKVWAPTNFYRAFHPGYENEIPYNVSLIELDEGPRVMSNVIGIPVEEIKVGLPVQVVYEDVTDEITLAKWRPI